LEIAFYEDKSKNAKKIDLTKIRYILIKHSKYRMPDPTGFLSDKDFSFTDCTSFSIMSSLKLKGAFAFDKHFEQFEGIGRLP